MTLRFLAASTGLALVVLAGCMAPGEENDGSPATEPTATGSEAAEGSEIGGDGAESAESAATAGNDADGARSAFGAAAAPACSDVSGTLPERSLAVTDTTALRLFSFTRVMNQIRSTANVAATDGLLAEYQRWMRTFGSTAAAGDCNDPNIDPNGFGLVCPRAPEAKLSKVNPFATGAKVTFRPVALFNRFDLTPAKGGNCGEYRVVFAMNSTDPNVGGRAFIIFEAALPNPTPTLGVEACLPVARFWQALSKDANATRRATALENFYFKGTAVPGFAPVIRAQHYGFSTNAGAPTAGQVRTNFFVDGREWHLREFKTKRVCTNVADPTTCRLDFAHVTVKANPADELFEGTHPLSAAFRAELPNRIPALLATDPARIGLAVTDRFNEFESSSQSFDVQYSATAAAATRTVIAQKLKAMGSKLSVNNVLDRATTQTCAGCHQVSNFAPLGGGVTWPPSLGFVQVDEFSVLSNALTQSFLPRRKVVLESFINKRCGPLPAPGVGAAGNAGALETDDDLTVGGSPVGAAN